MKVLLNYKVAHVALALAALTVALLRNHGVLTNSDTDALVSGLGAFGIALNINLGSDRNAVTTTADDVVGALTGAPDPGPNANV